MIYGSRPNGKEHGVVMTNPSTVDFILDLVGYTEDHDLSKVKVLDPCGGEGIFIIQCIHRLYNSSIKYNFSFIDSLTNLTVCEIAPKYVSLLRKNILKQLRTAKYLPGMSFPMR